MRADELQIDDMVCANDTDVLRTLLIGRVVDVARAADGDVTVRWTCEDYEPGCVGNLAPASLLRRWPQGAARAGQCTRVANLARALRVGRVVRTPDALLEQGHVVVRWRCRPSRGPLGRPTTVPASSLLRWPDRQRNFALPLETP